MRRSDQEDHRRRRAGTAPNCATAVWRAPTAPSSACAPGRALPTTRSGCAPACPTRVAAARSLCPPSSTGPPCCTIRHAHGREDLYALRQAALDTLQQIESGFNRLTTARKVFNGGEEHTRLLELTSLHALAELAALAETAMVVIDQRRRHGTPLAHAVPASGTVANGEGSGSPRRRSRCAPGASSRTRRLCRVNAKRIG